MMLGTRDEVSGQRVGMGTCKPPPVGCPDATSPLPRPLPGSALRRNAPASADQVPMTMGMITWVKSSLPTGLKTPAAFGLVISSATSVLRMTESTSVK